MGRIITLMAIAGFLIFCVSDFGSRRHGKYTFLQAQARFGIQERLSFWKGQKVILLTDTDEPVPYVRPVTEGERFSEISAKDQAQLLDQYRVSVPSERQPKSHYVETGVVVDARNGDYKDGSGALVGYSEFLVALDGSGEKVVVRQDYSLGFFAEMEIAKSLIGKSLWKKGYWPEYIENWKNTQKLTVSRAEWYKGKAAWDCSSIYLCFKADQGKDQCLEPCAFFGNERGGYIDPRFHSPGNGYRRPFLNDSLFFFEDPHKTYSRWPAGIWALIENREVAIGMTEEMVKVACGDDGYRRLGAMISPSNVGTIYEGCIGSRSGFQRFLMENGKVTKFVE
jgi:hypothetical protein